MADIKSITNKYFSSVYLLFSDVGLELDLVAPLWKMGEKSNVYRFNLLF